MIFTAMQAVFVDSKILIYSQDASDPHRRARAKEWVDQLWRTRLGRISYQVLREVYVNLTRKIPNPVPQAKARTLVRLFLAWNPRPEDNEFFEIAWDIENRFQLSWWDSMIAASARLSRCDFLLTEDLQDGLRLDDLTVLNPFSTSWEAFIQKANK
jgi:predicted nucleic acid-binding protein